jgi:hypothetical protein
MSEGIEGECLQGRRLPRVRPLGLACWPVPFDEPCGKTTVLSNQRPRPSVPSHNLGIRFEILVVKNSV